MVINHNMSALAASRNLNSVTLASQKGMERLSSGERINRAGDDASGLAVSEKLRSQIRGLNQASKNVQNGISFIQSAEGYLTETQDVLQRLRELSVQSANGIYTAEDRMQIQVEVSQLVDEIDRIASHAQFNGMSLLKGTSVYIQMGANTSQGETVKISDMSAEALGLKNAQGSGQNLSIDTTESAQSSLSTLDTALKVVSKQRADLGAYQNRFEMAVNGINVAAENLTASESRIRDTDMASEMLNYVKNNVLQQSTLSVLAQANSSTNAVLKILG